MPRRPPRKPDPRLDLSSHLLPLAALPEPFDPATLFRAAGPVELEVGSGKGLFLTSAATAAPDRNFIGVEIAHGYARLIAGRLAAAGLANARVIHGDAGFLVGRLLPNACLAGMHVYFPDPWWKARHRKRRVLSEGFLHQAGRVLAPWAILHVWTDVEEYFHAALAAARATGLFEPPREEEAGEPNHDLDYRTHFERRTRLAGMPVWRAALVRSPAAATVVRTTATASVTGSPPPRTSGSPDHRPGPGRPRADRAAPPPASDSGR
ncbi:MAG: tRNA (guanosine(46)-N7)-methyltransferase TrmB [Planctomycetes bacterium]|nr:tRNA (guanosine(46)-N7)-methyltransferase TrmB [Planctomycetota bacterium]